MKKRYWIIFFVLIFYVIKLHAQTQNELGLPFIRNYQADEYGVSPQNWAVLQDTRGIMYFGNTNGVLVFDGKYWELIPMPKHTSVRSLAMDENGTIYVGSMGEFGYLAFDNTGKLTYVSLSDRLPEKDKDFKNVWCAHATSHGLYFETSDKMFHFYKGEIKVYSLSISRSHKIRDAVIVKERNKNGLYVLRDAQPQLLPHTEEFPWESAGRHVILPYTGNQILIATQNQGMYVYDLDLLLENGSFVSDFSQKNIPSSVLKKIPIEIDKFLQNHEIYAGIKVNDHHYAFGTVKGGIVIMDQQGKLIQAIDKISGLQNNNVHYLFGDTEKNLWVALNQGISYIEISSPITQFNEKNGSEDLVESLIRNQGILYMGAANGCFYMSEYKMSLESTGFGFLPVKNYNTDCWALISVKNVVFAGGTGAIHQIKGKRAKKIKSVSRLYCFGRSQRFPDHIFLGMREGLAALQLIPSRKKDRESTDFLPVKYIDRGGFKQIKTIIRKITSDSKGNLWLTTRYSGIIYIRFNSQDISDFQIYQYNKSHGLPREDYNRVYFIDKRLIVASQRGIYEGILPDDFEANPTGIKFVHDEIFGNKLPNPSTNIEYIHVDKNQGIWTITGIGLGRFIKDQEGNYTWDGIPFKKVKTSDNMFYVESNGIVWSPAQNIIYRIDPSKQKDYQSNYNTLIRKVMAHRDKPIFNGTYYDPLKKSGEYYITSSLVQPDQLIKTLDYEDNSVTFEYSAAFYEDARANRFKYMLDGFDKDWSDWGTETHKEYTNLPAGSYRFKVKAKNIFEHESSVASFEFSISPPWYQTIVAYIGYVLTFLLIIYGAVMFNSRRLVAAKHRLEKVVAERTAEVKQQKDQLEEAFSQLAVANKKLEKLAITDGLTGIANYRRFEEFFNIEWKRTIRSGKPISVILTDIDFFKLFNDTYGHQLGDECLKRVAKVLDEIVNRAGDIVARYGGEEFVVVLSETDSEGANIIAERIRTGIESLEMVHEESSISGYVTISAGCATTIPKKDMDSATLIRVADDALYKSKQSGRNRVTVVNYQS